MEMGRIKRKANTMKHQALIELEQMEKTMENTKSYVSKHLQVVAFHFSQTHGFPVEMFEEEMKLKEMSLLDQLTMIIKFYKEK
jgi:hypothetical protein